MGSSLPSHILLCDNCYRNIATVLPILQRACHVLGAGCAAILARNLHGTRPKKAYSILFIHQ